MLGEELVKMQDSGPDAPQRFAVVYDGASHYHGALLRPKLEWCAAGGTGMADFILLPRGGGEHFPTNRHGALVSPVKLVAVFDAPFGWCGYFPVKRVVDLETTFGN